ncbi:GD18005 [Drosophila simulans]|uniref:GD18005 n=1 Tax=Drosophila simulans TaxID=7240 RepID=B4QZE4_DROSI|nr:GD18005 [Drosophila simulans]
MRYKIQYRIPRYILYLYYLLHFLKLIFLFTFLACNSKFFNDFIPVQLQLLPSPSASSPLSPFGLCSALSSAVFGFQFATPSPSPTPSVTPLSPTPFPPVPLYP